jgi:HAE1 family hydrophobic/amphiphilic exporter-1
MRAILKNLILSLMFVCCGIAVQAQTPTPTPTPSADDILKNLKPRPLPPLPDLKRIGVDNSNMITLSMNDAIRKALENNNDIEIAKDDVRLNENTFRALDGVYDPVFTFSPRFSDSTQDTGQVFSGATSSTIKQRSLQGNAEWTKLLRKGGSSYTVFFNNNRDTSNASLFTTSYRPSLGVTFTQPLWRGRKIDNNRRQISIQKKRLEQSDADFRRRTIEVITQVQRAYWDLVFALRDQQNKLENLNLTRENLRQVEAKIAAGSSAPLNRAEVQTELANREADVLVATQSVSVAENTLKSLIFRESDGAEWSASITPTDRPDPNLQSFSLTDALKDAIDNRPELNRLKLEKEINAIDIEYFKDQTKPKIDFNATFSLNGLAGTPRTPNQAAFTSLLITGDPNTVANAFLLQQVNILRNQLGLGNAQVPTITITPATTPNKLIGGYGKALGNLFKFDTRSFEFGATITLPWKNQVAKANLAGAKIQQERLDAQTRQQEQLIVVEVRNAVQAVETSRLRLQASRIARENAEIQLAGEQKLYQVGRSTTFLLFQRENALANARNAELRAETDYNKALADLQKATSTTLRVNNVTIESPMK